MLVPVSRIKDPAMMIASGSPSRRPLRARVSARVSITHKTPKSSNQVRTWIVLNVIVEWEATALQK